MSFLEDIPWRYYRAAVNDDFEHYIDKYYQYWQRLIPNKSIPQVFTPIWNEVETYSTRDIFRDVFTKHARTLTRPEDYINHSLYFEAKTFLHGLLVVEDKLSMAHSLETRIPFLDNDLVDFAMQSPVRFKLGSLGEVVRLSENEPGPKTAKYFEKTRDGKLLLRKVMEHYIPQEATSREKQGFSAPDASWFKGESVDYVRRRLYNRNARIYDYLDREAVQGLVNEHLEGKQNRRLLIWSLLNVENWCERFLPMKIALFSATGFGYRCLEKLINMGEDIVGIFTIPEEFNISWSPDKPVVNVRYANFKQIAGNYGIPVTEVRGKLANPEKIYGGFAICQRKSFLRGVVLGKQKTFKGKIYGN